MRLVCISDTHNRHGSLVIPDGDVLIHAGDLTGMGQLPKIAAAAEFLASQPHRHKVVIAGNHDWGFQRQPAEARALMKGVTYLEDSGTVIDGVPFWGSPWQPWFCSWAFNLQPGAELKEKWDHIPSGTKVLITHGPPAGILDQTVNEEHVGCVELRAAVERVQPRVHVFGHIHEAYGRHEERGTVFLNASICDVGYSAVNAALVLDL